jgi:hypothetical protein
MAHFPLIKELVEDLLILRRFKGAGRKEKMLPAKDAVIIFSFFYSRSVCGCKELVEAIFFIFPFICERKNKKNIKKKKKKEKMLLGWGGCF